MKPFTQRQSVVIIKFGALGDIVRTSYLVASLVKEQNARVTWITQRSGVDLLRFNPHIDRLVAVEDGPLPEEADLVVSLDDETEAVAIASAIRAPRLIGAYFNADGRVDYSEDARPWFDMGLVSRLGKQTADELKRLNQRSHVEIFSEILGLQSVEPAFFGNAVTHADWTARRDGCAKVVGFNVFAGFRWPAKELQPAETLALVREVQRVMSLSSGRGKCVVFADQSTASRAEELSQQAGGLEIWNTGRGVLDFAAAVAACDYVVSTDSLGLHLAIAQGVPNLSFYAPTSAAEIDTFDRGIKLHSTSPDYCSYGKHADNTTLTAVRLFEAWREHVSRLGWQHVG
jgi:heptosyltransferase-2